MSRRRFPIPEERSRHLTLVTELDGGQVNGRTSPPAVAPLALRYPELAPVLTRAMSAVLPALELGEHPSPALVRDLEQVAAAAMTEAYEPVADAASRLARSTHTSRTTEAATVRRKAEETAALVAQTAAALQERRDRLDERIAEEAVTAARARAASSVPGYKAEARRQAVMDASLVREAAAALVGQRAAAVAMTAAAASHAEAGLAVEAEHAAGIVERQALLAAAAVRATALDVIYEIAVDAVCRHFVVSMARTDGAHAP